MVEGDCGVKCGRFCCTGATAKYLLPGEERLFRSRHPNVAVARRPWYTQVFTEKCCCVREHRMFACRAFPFRPVVDRASLAVTGLVKAGNPLFEPCWIENANGAWLEKAAQAWEIVIGDADNRRLYGRIRFLSNLLDRMGEELYDIPETGLHEFFEQEIAGASEEELQALFFDYFQG